MSVLISTQTPMSYKLKTSLNTWNTGQGQIPEA